MPISGRFYTSQELIKLLGVTKQRISNLAKEQGFIEAAPGLWYDTEVDEYLTNRQRTDLLKAAGWWNGKGLCLWDEVDIDCPECGAYAVHKPYLGEEQDYYGESWPWRCSKGHSKE